MMDHVRYPIGTFERPATVSTEQRTQWLREIADAPANLRRAVDGLSIEQSNTPYRPDGWTVCQIVHHLAENDIVVYTRFKFALTEDNPVIMPAAEDRWAELPDRNVPLTSSLGLFQLIHERWVALLSGLQEDDLRRSYVHPVSGEWRLDEAMGLYVWHDRHHTAQITGLRERMGW